MPSQTVTLPHELEAFVAEQVAAGSFGSTEEVIAAALYYLRDLTDRAPEGQERLREAIAVGLEADRGELIDGPAAIERLRERHPLST
jgi:putative addiction module CopG family antidote